LSKAAGANGSGVSRWAEWLRLSLQILYHVEVCVHSGAGISPSLTSMDVAWNIMEALVAYSSMDYFWTRAIRRKTLAFLPDMKCISANTRFCR
jgi:hypothetical protein